MEDRQRELKKSSYTKAGAALLSESLSGGALTITRAASSTGSVDTDLSAETAVSGDTHELSLLGIETVTDDGKTARKVSIQATGAADTYVMHQIGVFGVLNDGTETLLFLMQDERGIEVPAASTNSSFRLKSPSCWLFRQKPTCPSPLTLRCRR